jgi:putative DNA primase/helicase
MDNTVPWIKPTFDAIPEELIQQPWAVWKAEPRQGQPGKYNKAPRRPSDGQMVGTNKPELFGTFDEARAAYDGGGYTGVGVLLTGSGIIGVDIDNYKDTFNEFPAVDEWARGAVTAGAYCERSPSKTGLRLFMRGKLPGTGRKSGNLEIYDKTRFLTVTGAVLTLKKGGA